MVRKKKATAKRAGTRAATTKTRKKGKARAAKKAAPKRPRGRPRKHPPKSEQGRCQGTRVDGQPCTAAAVIGGFCGRHKAQIDKPADWQKTTVEEVERRKQFSLMRRRELEVAEEEARLVDAGLARTECLRIASQIQEQFATIPARRSHELAAALGVSPGKVAAALEVTLRSELKDIAEAL